MSTFEQVRTFNNRSKKGRRPFDALAAEFYNRLKDGQIRLSGQTPEETQQLFSEPLVSPYLSFIYAHWVRDGQSRFVAGFQKYAGGQLVPADLDDLMAALPEHLPYIEGMTPEGIRGMDIEGINPHGQPIFGGYLVYLAQADGRDVPVYCFAYDQSLLQREGYLLVYAAISGLLNQPQ